MKRPADPAAVHSALATLAAVVTLAALAAVAPPVNAKGQSFAGPVEIRHDRSLYLECRGRGRPTVILEAGLRSRGDTWSTRTGPEQPAVVFDSVSRFTRVCEYDRPGTLNFDAERSRSDPVAMPRTAGDAVADLHHLIRAAEIRRRIVLVGHSAGGLLVRLYASAYPRQVVGMVQVDALAERLQRAMTEERFSQYAQLNEAPIAGLDYPELEVLDFDRSFAEMRHAQRRTPLGEIPLIVISKGLPFEIAPALGPEFASDLEAAWLEGQRMLARLLPDARHWIARRSGHSVMLEQPRMVIRAIRRAVAGHD